MVNIATGYQVHSVVITQIGLRAKRTARRICI